MLVLPVCGTLRGAGDEKVGGCLDGVLVEGVGVAMIVVSSAELGFDDRVLSNQSRFYRHGIVGGMLFSLCW